MKVLSHEGSQSARVNALHESVVSQHVSHPNVVRLCLCSVHIYGAVTADSCATFPGVGEPSAAATAERAFCTMKGLIFTRHMISYERTQATSRLNFCQVMYIVLRPTVA